MMKNHRFFFVISVYCLLMACNQTQELAKSTLTEAEPSTEQLHLNEGEKWIANEETDIGMRNLNELLKQQPEGMDYDELLSKMEVETQYIIKSCTMKGKAHDQLHLVLLPIIEHMNAMKQEVTLQDKQKKLEVIKQYLTAYFQYFKVENS
ncbi:MAG: hypothetical protein ACPGJS_02470 [Flammeovirgaceae bacterium]